MNVMKAYDLQATMKAPANWTSEDGEASFWMLDSFNKGSVWVGRYSGQSPWERHPDGDELLYVIEGEAAITLLTDDGPVETTLHAGSVFVVPQGLWHRVLAREVVIQFGATPGRTDHSTDDDPLGNR